jgi:hypothetical protein
MVPSELIGEGSIGGLLVFLGCWRKGPYIVSLTNKEVYYDTIFLLYKGMYGKYLIFYVVVHRSTQST